MAVVFLGQELMVLLQPRKRVGPSIVLELAHSNLVLKRFPLGPSTTSLVVNEYVRTFLWECGSFSIRSHWQVPIQVGEGPQYSFGGGGGSRPIASGKSQSPGPVYQLPSSISSGPKIAFSKANRDASNTSNTPGPMYNPK